MGIPNKPNIANPDLALISAWGGTKQKPTALQISQGFGSGTALGKYYASTTINWNNDYFFEWQAWCANTVDYIAKNTELYIDNGLANTFELTILSGENPTSYTDGMRVRFFSNSDNTGACTIDVEGIGIKSIVTYDGDTLISGQVDSGKYVEAVYSSSLDKFVIANITFTDGFVKTDGTTPFANPQTGVTPTSANHLATKAYVDGSTPSGSVMAFASPTPPSGWLYLNGQAVSRATYANLFAVIGTIYGAGNGSTTFHLPDARGLGIRGWDDSRGFDIGRVFGSYQADMIKSHSHIISGQDNSANPTGAASNEVANVENYPSTFSRNTSSTGDSETVGKNIAMIYIIKA